MSFLMVISLYDKKINMYIYMKYLYLLNYFGVLFYVKVSIK